MAKKKNQRAWLNVGVGVLLTAVAFAGASAIEKLNDSETKTLKSYDYAIECLNAEGQIEDGTDFVTTREFHKLAALESIEVGAHAVKYYVNVYNENKEFVSVNSEAYTKSFTAEEIEALKASGTYFKIEIRESTGDGIDWYDFFEKSTLIKRVEVTLLKEVEEAESKTEDAETTEGTENTETTEGTEESGDA